MSRVRVPLKMVAARMSRAGHPMSLSQISRYLSGDARRWSDEVNRHRYKVADDILVLDARRIMRQLDECKPGRDRAEWIANDFVQCFGKAVQDWRVRRGYELSEWMPLWVREARMECWAREAMVVAGVL